jgi:hypothetical protein
VVLQPERGELEPDPLSRRRHDDPRAVAVVRVVGGVAGWFDGPVGLREFVFKESILQNNLRQIYML